MRCSEIDLQCEDITWFGVDANNHVKAILRDHSINADFAEINQIQVPHAY